MNIKPTLTICAAIALAISFTGNSARADRVDLQQVLHGNSRCDHVIAMLMRHGVNNSRNLGDTSMMVHPLAGVSIPASEFGDLQLLQVTQVGDLQAGCGPKFLITIKNCSTRDVAGFRVTIVGLFGRIQPFSPNCTVKVDKICAGQAVEIPVSLPIEALSMGNHNGQILGFQRLLIAIDSFDQFLECDEANNLRVFDRAKIPVATAAVEAAPAEQTTPISTTPSATIDASAAAPQAAAPQATAPQPQASQPVASELKSALDQFSEQSEATDVAAQ